MADEFNTGTNWWDSSRTAGSSSSSSGLDNRLGSFGWATEMADIKTAAAARSSMDSVSSVSGSSVVFQENDKLQAMDWNQALLRGEKHETSFRSMLQDHNLSTSNVNYHHPQEQKETGFDQLSYENSSTNYQYGMNTNDQFFLRSSPPKQQQLHQLHGQLHFSNNAPFWNPSAVSMADHVKPGHFPPSLQPQFPTGNFDEKPKNISQVRDSSTVVKKSGNEPTSKRPRNETPSTMPAFKVRKEKMGDRINTLQQLVSPFGKTDTASVLSEAIEYIKFLHEQVSVLITPYMKNNEAAIQHQQVPEKSNDPEGPKQDLRRRGLCLVPVSSTFPLTHDSPVDFWTPTFGATFR
ncbi:bHLH112 protein [Hibiscus syriacus]|uniref:BHLH112 protein n=1 Tax=Hibiscus syriacus TaxID=106335 RepID=A0A6A2XWN4_HIBSY|nr:bHLH112 protein [Hibiscus syriacus]